MAVCLATWAPAPTGRLAPLQVGLRRSVPRPEHGGVHQHAVDLAGQPLDAVVALVGDLRPGARWTAARARRGLSASSRWPRCRTRTAARCCAWQALSGQGLAAGAGAEVHHHLAALGVQQQGQQLRASSCTSMAPRVKASSLVSGGLPERRPQGEYGVGTGGCRPRPALLHLGAFVVQRIDAQVQRRALAQGVHQGQNLHPSSWSLSGCTSHSGRLCRWRSIRSAGWMPSHWSSQFFSLLGQGAFEEVARTVRPEWPAAVSRGRCRGRENGRTAGFCAARVHRLGQRRRSRLASARWSRK